MNIIILSSLTNAAKKLNKILTIGTHKDIFHSYEVVACAILCLMRYLCNKTNFDIFCDDYLEKNVVPEYIAFYISQLFYTNSIGNDTFSQHFNSASDVFNFDIKDVDTIKARVRRLLKVKYYLRIVCEEPLRFKKI